MSTRRFAAFTIGGMFALIFTIVLVAQMWPVACGLLPLTPLAVAGFAYNDVPKGAR